MRGVINLNQGWKFIQKDAGLPASLPEDWQDIDLPHTWNAVDGQDGTGYDRGRYWYAREFQTPKQPLPGGRVYLEIPAAGQQAEVYVNGKKMVSHEGGYSAFRADITDACKEGQDNLLAIACSNEYRDNVYPQMADFTFYGGLYRGVNIISVPDTHFDLDYYGGPGIRVTPALSADMGASFEIEAFVKNADENFTVLYQISDQNGREVAYGCRPADDAKIRLTVPDAKLWNPDNPYLYTVTAVLQRRNESFDEVSTRAGVRSFSCDPQKGFIINGVETPLRGVSRHQDRLYKGNALTKEEHVQDAALIKELGANAIRLAHYQHSQDFYDACDELGFVVWAEIPFISAFNEAPGAHQNCIQQMKELIIQNYNHPCICFWGLSNEILIGGISEKLIESHRELQSLAKELDPARLTAIAHVSMTPLDSPMLNIADVNAYNHYFGWYGGKTEDNGPWFDRFHAMHPDLPIGLSEYGCEGIVTYHSKNPMCKDYTEDYQAIYHEHMAKMLEERPYIWGSFVWNMFDFGCSDRNEGGVAGRNNKGLVTIDRKTKKDSFYLYKAYWNPEPMVHICGKRYAQREDEDITVKVYSNQKNVALYVNGERIGEQEPKDRVCLFAVCLKPGMNSIIARAGEVTDSTAFEKVDQEPSVYTLPEFGDRMEGVRNWFTLSGSLDLTAPMEFPDGKYHVRCTMDELAKSPEAWKITAEAIFLAANMQLSPKSGMWKMVESMTLEGLFNQFGTVVPEGFLEKLNAKLNKIDTCTL